MKKVDRYEYNLKLEEIDKLVDQRDYGEAAKLADTIDWKRVRNVRTLCLVSEIYEAAGRPEDSKTLLERAYRRSPVGRTVLYRLVEVTIQLHQYDEAMEYYTEYINVAPNDTNRFILKYRIYRGRGASPEELIPILEEYASLEYTEQWTYELAKLYQQAGQIQKCLAMCDDLVLWFHSGKYVLKALELKKKYARLTPKQEEIYNEQFIRPAETPVKEEQPPEKTEDMLTTVAPEVNSEAIAATIIASTEKEIAGEIAAHKAELEQAELEQAGIVQTEPEQEEPAQTVEEQAGEPDAEAEQPAAETDSEEESREEMDLQVELAKSMREIISGVVKRTVEPEEPGEPEEEMLPKKLQPIPQAEPQTEPGQEAGKLSIDDILLSMGEKGRALAQSAREAQKRAEADKSGEVSEDVKEEEPSSSAESAREELQKTKRLDHTREDMKEEILREKTIRVPTDKIASLHARYGMEELWEEQAHWMRDAEEEAQFSGGETGEPGSEDGVLYEAEEPEVVYEMSQEDRAEYEPDEDEAYAAENPDEIYEPANEYQPEDSDTVGEPEETAGEESFVPPQYENPDEDAPEVMGEEDAPSEQLTGEEEFFDIEEDDFESGEEFEMDEEGDFADAEEEAAGGDRPVPAKEGPLLPDHIREFFEGFTEIEGLEQQIANAVFQAAANSGDRTSRTGNILIFGPHGAGKTTLALNIAKAAAQDRGSDTLKVAKIYAADFNRKDIAATVAKIAGGTLIIEEAGDLDTNAIEQLTTAMEFRTDGMLVILEDEQQYMHDLLMSHPRFTMKFTAQIYLPDYTAQELVMFAQLYAGRQDYVISEDGRQVLLDKISAAADQGSNVSIANVAELVNHAIHRSNKLLRKMTMGKKRYDENDFIILYAKDFK